MTKLSRIAAVLGGVIAFAAVPLLAPPFYANLLVPFFGYAIALLGFNLLFGYGGLSRSGTRCFSAWAPMARR